MSRVDVTQSQAMEAVRLKLLEKFPALNDSTCFFSINPMQSVIPPGGDFWLTVSAGDGQFDQEMMDGSVADQCLEYGEVIVSAYSRIRLDRVGRDTSLMDDDARGLLSLKHQILKSLSGSDLLVPEEEPTDTFLRELLRPIRTTAPDVFEVANNPGRARMEIGIVSIVFSLHFDWDLS